MTAIYNMGYSLLDATYNVPRLVAKEVGIVIKLLEACGKCPGVRVGQFAKYTAQFDLVTGVRDCLSTAWESILWQGQFGTKYNAGGLDSLKNLVKHSKDLISGIKFYTDSAEDSPLKKSVETIKALWDGFDALQEMKGFFFGDPQTRSKKAKIKWVQNAQSACKIVGAVANASSSICYFGKLTKKMPVSDKITLVFGAIGVGSVIASEVLKSYEKRAQKVGRYTRIA